MVPAQHVTVAGAQFEDLNANGVRDAGELGLAGLDHLRRPGQQRPARRGRAVRGDRRARQLHLDVNLVRQQTFRVMEQRQVGWAQTFDPAATANEPTAAHPYYTLPFADRNQRDIDFSNQRTNFVVTTSGDLQTTETGFTASFTVVLTSQPTSDVTIPVSSSDSTEGTVSTAQLIFTPDNWNVPQTVTVTGQSDAIVDGNVRLHHRPGPEHQPRPELQQLAEAIGRGDQLRLGAGGQGRHLPRAWRSAGRSIRSTTASTPRAGTRATRCWAAARPSSATGTATASTTSACSAR